MHILYPQSPFGKHVDEQYKSEHRLMCEKFTCSYVEYDDLVLGHACSVPEGKTIIYRGWPLPTDTYDQLSELAQAHQSNLLTTQEQYTQARNMKKWYPLLKDHCAPTIFVEPNQSFADIPYEKAFVRNVVKSGQDIPCEKSNLPQKVKSLSWECLDADDAIAIRAFEDYNERHRLMVYNKQVYAHRAPSEAVALGLDVARRLNSPFFCVDVAKRKDGEWRVWDVEDGQVADLAEWPVESFVGIVHQLGEADKRPSPISAHLKKALAVA